MKNLSLPVLSGKLLPCFPCCTDKRPMTPRGLKDAADWPFPYLVLPPSGAFQPAGARLEGEHAPLGAKPQQTRDLRKRTKSILRIVEMAPRSTRNDRLFWAACRFGEIVAEGLLNPPVAELVLTSAAHLNGLVRDDGLAQVRATIASGLTTGLAQPHPNHGESWK